MTSTDQNSITPTPAPEQDGPTYVDGVPAILSALDWLNRETRALAKSQRNKEQGYNFRGIDDLYNAMHPLLASASVMTIPGEILEVRSEQRMTKKGFPQNWTMLRRRYRILSLRDGSEQIAEGTGEAMDSGDKGMNKAQTNAHKYLLFQLFTIPTDEPESDHTQPEASGRYENPQFQRWDANDLDTWGPAAMGGHPNQNPPQARPEQTRPRPGYDAAPTPPRPAAPTATREVPTFDLDNLTANLQNAEVEEDVKEMQRHLIASMRSQQVTNAEGLDAMKLIRARLADFEE